MLLKKITLFSLLNLFLVGAYAQQKNNTSIADKSILLRWNISGLIDVLETNVSAGAEYRINNKVSTALDIGYIFNSNYYGDAQLSTSGIIIRPAVKVFIGGEAKRMFVAAQGHYKLVNDKLYDWLDKAVVNGVPTYSQLQNFTLQKRVVGVHFLFGAQLPLDKNKRLWIEPYIGLGIKGRKTSVLNEPNSNYNNRSMFRNTNNNGSAYEMLPTLPFGFNLLLRLN